MARSNVAEPVEENTSTGLSILKSDNYLALAETKPARKWDTWRKHPDS